MHCTEFHLKGQQIIFEYSFDIKVGVNAIVVYWLVCLPSEWLKPNMGISATTRGVS